MIDLYTWSTPNGRKVSIMLEELGLPYRVHAVDIGRNAQHAPEFLAINPNHKIPAIGDPAGPNDARITLFESGAILIYLAEKTGRFLPASGADRYATLQWLMWQMGGFGPMLGQAHHFNRFASEDVPYAKRRYVDETVRLYRVLDGVLAKHPFVAGREYSIADIAIFPWAHRWSWQGISLHDFSHVKRWFEMVGARPAVQRGMNVPAET